jgi:o-succinylbenzoate synthase
MRLAHRRYALPFRRPIRTAHGLWTVREGLLLRLDAGNGRVGYAEVAPVPGFPGPTAEGIAAELTALGEAPAADALEEAATRVIGLRAALAEARAGEDPALVDTAAEAGGGTLAVAALLPAGREALERVDDRLEQGFRTFKWKVGVGDPADELGLLDDLLARLPGGAKLRLDANGAWDRRRSERWLERCAERPMIEFLEQPVAPETRGADDLLLGLAADYPTPIALDESLAVDGDVTRWLGRGWPGVFVIKPTLLRDPEGVVAALARARAGVVFSSALETAVGARAALRLAVDWKGERRALGFGVGPLFQDVRFEGLPTAAFWRRSDVERLDPEVAWTALS